MFAYQMRRRVIQLERGKQVTFPSLCEICFHFRPPQPFGDAVGGGRTGVRAVAAKLSFDGNKGKHTLESEEPLSPLDVTLESPNRTVRLTGATLTISEQCESLQEVEKEIQRVYFVLPTVLNIPFADPPYVEKVDGKIGSTGFRWSLAAWGMVLRTTTQQKQEDAFAKAWERMALLTEERHWRLVAGLHFFHVACRLDREGYVVGEFVPEVVLNLAKCLEVLFPPSGDGRSRDAARDGLRALRFLEDEIECDFIPAMALRNEIDVGHVELGLFTLEQRTTIQAYAERAELAFSEMFERLLVRLESTEIGVVSHEPSPPRSEAIKLIERLQKAAAERDAARGRRHHPPVGRLGADDGPRGPGRP